MGSTKLAFALCGVFLLAGGAIPLHAQGDRGSIRGTVKDVSGGVVPKAAVSVTHTATNTEYKSVTTATGDFTVPNLPIGAYTVKVTMAGFKTLVQDAITLEGGGSVNLDLQLQIGGTQETIEVSASTSVIQTDTARVATQVSTRLVNDLPVQVYGDVRSPFDLATVTADTSGGGNGLRIGGGRSGSFGMTLDGTSILASNTNSAQSFSVTNTPSVEALAEFAVESSGFKAETGHASGGTVSFVSKSGTNQFHGSAYEFLRNQKLDARGFFNTTKSILKQNNYGITIGGPVRLPKLYDGRNKTFFFYSFEGFRNRVGASVTPTSVPPTEFYTGDLRNWVDATGKQYPVYDPDSTTLQGSTYSRAPFANNQIPLSRIDPVALQIIGVVQPLIAPNVPNLVPGTSGYVRNNYVSVGSTRSPDDKQSLKIDQSIGTKHHLSFFWGHTWDVDTYGPTGPPGLPAPLAGNPGFNKSNVYRLSHDWTISPSMLNRLNFGANYFQQNHGSYGTVTGSPLSFGLPTVKDGWKSKVCIPNYPDCDINFPQVSTGDFGAWGVAAPNGSDNIGIEVKDDFTKIWGKHTFKAGVFYDDSLYAGFGLQNVAGNVSFATNGTSVPLSTNINTGGGSGFASFLLGQVNSYSLDTPRYLEAHYRSGALYFQDDWRVSSRLTLNLGVRVEEVLAPRVGNDQASDLDPDLANPAADGIRGALVFAGIGEGRIGSHTLVDNWYGVAPRLGFVYSLNSKMTIRGYSGISFGPVVHTGNSSHNLGFVQRITAGNTTQGLTPTWVLKDGAPAYPDTPNLDPSVGNGANIPYYNGRIGSTPSEEYNFSLNLQRELTQSLALEVGYLGVMASHIQSSLLTLNALNYSALPAALNPFTASGRSVLASQVGSATANSAGISAPFSSFKTLWGTGASVGQAVRPFPQFSAIDTTNGGGDRIGHSTYHSMEVKLTKRYASGLTFNGSWVFSKYMTDADGGAPEDPLNRRLEKSLSPNNQTHVVKAIYSYEFPFGRGKRFLSNPGILRMLAGGWKLAGIHSYSTGSPMSISTTVSFPLFAGSNRPTVSTYEGWRAPLKGDQFDPAVDNFFQPVAFFGTQPTDRLGNMTRVNPKLNNFASLSENVSFSRTFAFRERARFEFRAEAFNVLNRVQFGALSTSLQSANFGLWRTQANSPRRMQMSLKLYW
jgi:hypothetical protein